jgi:hypothetical protein
MLTTFELFYDLAVAIQTQAQYRHLTAHHDQDRVAVEARLQQSLLQSFMPGEEFVDGPWRKTRVFFRNYVNRSHPAVTGDQMLQFLNDVEQRYPTDEERLSVLPELAERNLRGARLQELTHAMRVFTAQAPVAELGNATYPEWIEQRWVYWVNVETQDLDAEELLRDIRVLCHDKPTRIPGMGLPLTANFFADLRLRVFAKPDLHVTPIINFLTLGSGQLSAFLGVVRIAKVEAPLLRSNRRFSWLSDRGGLSPRVLDRLIYLIGSDNFRLDGTSCKRYAPQRRAMMLDALGSSGFISGHYQLEGFV